MRRNRRFTLALTALLLAALACNLPQATPPASEEPNAAFTAAALTVAAQLTQSAGQIQATPTNTQPGAPPPPTNTNVPPTIAPLPTNTNQPTPTTECDKAQFISDQSIPDGTSMTAGETFTKIWRIKNIGTCTWSGYSLVFDSGNSMSGAASSAIGNTPPGGTVDISINLTAPAATGNYRGYWRIRSASGYLLPVINGYEIKSFYVDIKVVSGGGGTFAVTSVTYTLTTWSDAGHTNCPRVIAHITVNGAGTVSFKWTRADTPAGGATQTVTFAAAGSKNVRYDWARGNFWAGTPTWVGIYVIDPNNQNFGHLTFNDACTFP
jgi:Ig-like domain from next to BRCA1 gene